MCGHQSQHPALPANVRSCAEPQTPLTQSRAHSGNGDLFFWKCFCGEWHLLTTEKANLNPKEFSAQGKQVPKSTHCPKVIIRTFYVPRGNVWRLIAENAQRESTTSTPSLCAGRGGKPEKKTANADLKCPPINSFLAVLGAERTLSSSTFSCSAYREPFGFSPTSVLSPYQDSHRHITGHPQFTTLLWQGWLHATSTPNRKDRTRPQFALLDRQREHFKAPQKSLRLHPPLSAQAQALFREKTGSFFPGSPELKWPGSTSQWDSWVT